MKKFFRLITLLEGLSYILLLFIAVPLKYGGGDDFLVKILGMPHGVLFMLYLALAFYLKDSYEWKWQQTAVVFLASIVPFGTFYVDRKCLKDK
jgi:integral membrane protein